MAEHTEAPKHGMVKKPSPWPMGITVIVLCLGLAGLMAAWHFRNRAALGTTFNADVEFLTSPDTVRAGAASRFVVRVEKDNADTPLKGRVMDVTVTPPGKAQIVSISGGSGQEYAAASSRAKGRTDSSGSLDIMISASEPGKYTLVALDSASNKEGTVNFLVVAPGG